LYHQPNNQGANNNTVNTTILIFVLVITAALIIYGKKYGHLEMSLVGFAFLFILGLAVAGNNVLGLSSGIEYQSGHLDNYSYDVNATGQNDDIQSITRSYTYTSYTSTFLGSWIAIISFLGALGIILGETIWKRKL
jgi:hypothetical protein